MTRVLCLAQEEGMPFLQQLQAEAMRNMDDPINEMMQRMSVSPLPSPLRRSSLGLACSRSPACLASETLTALVVCCRVRSQVDVHAQAAG